MRWNLALGALAASWGFIAVLAAAVDLGAEALAFWRLALAAATLVLVALATRRLDRLAPRGRLGALAALGVVQGAHWLFFFEAVEHGSVALAVLTFYAAPLLIALAAPFVLGERTSRVVLGACLVGALGIAAIALDDGGDGAVTAAAVAAGLASAATYAVLVLLSKRLLTQAIPPLTVAFWDCLVGAVAVAPALLLADRVVPDGRGSGVPSSRSASSSPGSRRCSTRCCCGTSPRRRPACSRSSSRSPASSSPGRCSSSGPARRRSSGARSWSRPASRSSCSSPPRLRWRMPRSG